MSKEYIVLTTTQLDKMLRANNKTRIEQMADVSRARERSKLFDRVTADEAVNFLRTAESYPVTKAELMQMANADEIPSYKREAGTSCRERHRKGVKLEACAFSRNELHVWAESVRRYMAASDKDKGVDENTRRYRLRKAAKNIAQSIVEARLKQEKPSKTNKI